MSREFPWSSGLPAAMALPKGPKIENDWDMNTEVHLAAIRKDGFTVIPGAFDPLLVNQLRNRIIEIHGNAVAPHSDDVPYLNRGHHVIYNLQDKDLLFFRGFSQHLELRALLMGLLNDTWYRQIPSDSPNYILRSLSARSGGPAPLPLHIDSFIPSSGSLAWSVQAAIVLEDQYPENGCTVVVPGSHLYDRYADQGATKASVPIRSRAGDLVIWDSRLWHGTTGNGSGKSRWSLVATFVRWWIKQNYDVTRYLPENFYAQLTDEEKAIMGYCSIPPRDEFRQIDIKTGYSDLQATVKDFF